MPMNAAAEVHRSGQVYVKEGRIAAVGGSVEIDETTPMQALLLLQELSKLL